MVTLRILPQELHGDEASWSPETREIVAWGRARGFEIKKIVALEGVSDFVVIGGKPIGDLAAAASEFVGESGLEKQWQIVLKLDGKQHPLDELITASTDVTFAALTPAGQAAARQAGHAEGAEKIWVEAKKETPASAPTLRITPKETKAASPGCLVAAAAFVVVLAVFLL